MTEVPLHTFSKKERLSSLLLIEKLFNGGNKSFPSFPLRIVCMPVDGVEESFPSVSVLISVPKKRFKRAVKRNYVKRQIREAYRKHKSLLTVPLQESGRKMVIAFVWLDHELYPSSEVEKRVEKLLRITAERML